MAKKAKTAILVDQPGSFVVLSTLGILVATIYSRIPMVFKLPKDFLFHRLSLFLIA
jgi:hypothetical protein